MGYVSVLLTHGGLRRSRLDLNISALLGRFLLLSRIDFSASLWVLMLNCSLRFFFVEVSFVRVNLHEGKNQPVFNYLAIIKVPRSFSTPSFSLNLTMSAYIWSIREMLVVTLQRVKANKSCNKFNLLISNYFQGNLPFINIPGI